MALKVIRTVRVSRDIQREWNYLFKHGGLEVADRFLDAVEMTVALLLRNPLAGTRSQATNMRVKKLRHFPVRPTSDKWILHVAVQDGIVVLRVVHGMRHPDQLRPSFPPKHSPFSFILSDNREWP